MMTLELLSIIAVFAPLLGAVLVGFNTSCMKKKYAQIITCVLMVISAISSLYIFSELMVMVNPLVKVTLLKWFDIGDFQANWTITVDKLTAVMFVVVSVVSSVVHIYSVGYMSHDKHPQRFMAYLSAFTFCMLMLVSSDNFVQLFFGWEGVGVCSYLLIGFWFKKPSANAAAMKAFLVNRVGDLGFALGIFMVFWVMGTVEFAGLHSQAILHRNDVMDFMGFEIKTLTFICLLLFIGAMGKSAQLGLHTWLPDAMEGPTPVSALIHAATMVTAGVFMLARCSMLFEYSEMALLVITIVGAVTCLFAASVALVQDDIKKIIAYSTCSQLGYMFFACGVSAYSAGVFHLMTHAFFKALLFLGAGSVIHAMSDEQNIKKMGGIWKKIPVTYAFMWIGSLALAGVYPFAGFFSKDIILESAYASHNGFGQIAYWIGLTVAMLTAFYSWRLLLLTFHGKPRASKEVMSHVHESPKIMILPLVVLVIGAITSGFIGSNLLEMVSSNGEFWNGAIFVRQSHNVLEHAHHLPQWVAILPSVAGIVGIALAYVFYFWKPKLPGLFTTNFKGVFKFLSHKWYFDEMYEKLFVRSSKSLGRFLWRKIDMIIVDGIPNGLAAIAYQCAKITSFFQSGVISQYAFTMMFGLLIILTWALLILDLSF